MIGDEENTEFINEISKQEKNESNAGLTQENKKNYINRLIYFGSTFSFMCIIQNNQIKMKIQQITIQLYCCFGILRNKAIKYSKNKQAFIKQNHHYQVYLYLIQQVISQEDFDYFNQLSNTTKVSNCNQSISNENTLIIISNQIINDDIKNCIELLKPKFNDILLIIYNATQESILQEVDNNVNQYYLSSNELLMPNSKMQKFENLDVDEQQEVVVQIINNIFK